MDITDFAEGRPWAITPCALDMLVKRMESFRADSKEIQAAFSLMASDQTESEYEMVNGVAIIPISGAITKGFSFLSFLFGGTAITDLRRQFSAALNDPAVKAIVFVFDSPGGTVSGVNSLASDIFAARGQKPIVSFADGQMASAAYWIGSSAHLIVAESTAILGSIGTLAEHREFSKADELQGIKRTYIASGKFKALGNDAEPLGAEARNMIQGMMDYLYSIFVDAVARNREVPVETVLSDMADGRDLIGKQAVDAGLADVVGTLGTAVELALIMVNDNQIK